MGTEAKILLVDDEASIRELIRFNLERAGYRVQEATDGNEAINAVRQTKPDLVVLDSDYSVLQTYCMGNAKL